MVFSTPSAGSVQEHRSREYLNFGSLDHKLIPCLLLQSSKPCRELNQPLFLLPPLTSHYFLGAWDAGFHKYSEKKMTTSEIREQVAFCLGFK